MIDFVKLPLFPLSNQVFVGGRMTLRIFEPRYLRMVKTSFQQQHGFAVCMLHTQASAHDQPHIYPIATRVDIIDFDPLEDGLLGITVEGKQRLQLSHIQTEADGLYVADAKVLPNWPNLALNANQQGIAEQLQQVYHDYPDLAQLYPQPQFNDASWVAQRWLEIVPLNSELKQQLWRYDDPNPALRVIDELLQKH